MDEKACQRTGNTYTCNICKEESDYMSDEEWSEEDAEAESKKLFVDNPPGGFAVICDDCFKKVMGWAVEQTADMLEESGFINKRKEQTNEASAASHTQDHRVAGQRPANGSVPHRNSPVRNVGGMPREDGSIAGASR